MTAFGNVVTKSREVVYEQITDVVGDRASIKPFHHYKASFEGSVENGLALGFVHLDNWPSLLHNWDYDRPHDAFSSSAQDVYSRMVAGTAPHRPEFSVPTAFFEGLKDFPGTLRSGFRAAKYLKDNGHAIANKFGRWISAPSIPYEEFLKRVPGSVGEGVIATRKTGSAYLAYNFGYAPFVNDIRKAALVALQIEKRRREIERLRDSGVLTRRWNIEDTQGPVSTFSNVHVGQYANQPVDIKVSSHGRRWATVRWYPTPNTALPKTDSELIAVMLGLNIPNALLAGWEAMPFSWMVDYFSNVGDVLAATANGAQYNVEGCVMTETTLKVEHPGVTRVEPGQYDYTLSSGRMTRTHKQREIFVGSPGLTVFGSLLGPKQLSILAALAATGLK